MREHGRMVDRTPVVGQRSRFHHAVGIDLGGGVTNNGQRNRGYFRAVNVYSTREEAERNSNGSFSGKKLTVRELKDGELYNSLLNEGVDDSYFVQLRHGEDDGFSPNPRVYSSPITKIFGSPGCD